ncbi:hypothetical protein DV515_00009601 [Chloebia gouldiae]|uniref:Uncharacterized protein n=1 Tax=Chloebia gouldiae TaxID=44316 RepID=A0A3L8SCD9_CHLGU|nr:hypothetical protein DV515_00009601 [Chloebia gouldiae]
MAQRKGHTSAWIQIFRISLHVYMKGFRDVQKGEATPCQALQWQSVSFSPCAKSRSLPAWYDPVGFGIPKAEFGWRVLCWCLSHGAVLLDTAKAQFPHDGAS